MESPLLPVGGEGVVVANDWCINTSNISDNLHIFFEKELSFLNLFLKTLPRISF